MRRRSRQRLRPRLSAVASLLSASLVVLTLGACQSDQSALLRGDRAWADSGYQEALAEYRLALARHVDEATQLRVAHAFATTGNLERARDVYQAVLASDSGVSAQAAYDFLTLARKAQARSDIHDVASAVDAALAVRPRLELGKLAPVLARYFSDTGDTRRAIDLYQRALLSAPPDSVPRYLYQIGRLYQSQGKCDTALDYLTAFRHGGPASHTKLEAGEELAQLEKSPGAEHPGNTLLSEARWALGSCAFSVARQEHGAGQLDVALDHLRTVTGLGVPRNIQDQAWFERGEVLLAMGQKDKALAAYYRVLQLDPTGQGQLVERAHQRIDQIRFGG